MTVKEYIEALQKLPQDAEVVRLGYEEGFDPVEEGPSLVMVELDPEQVYWKGKYQLAESGGQEVVVL